MHLVRYKELRAVLMATPPSLPQDFAPDTAAARPVIDGVLSENRTWLDPVELTRLLSACRAFRLRQPRWRGTPMKR